MTKKNYPTLILHLRTRIPFGKYRDFSTLAIFRIDAGYIQWLVENADVKLSVETQKIYDDYFSKSKRVDNKAVYTIPKLCNLLNYYELTKNLSKSEITKLLEIFKRDDVEE